jgi:sulfonate transport system substrate-binding protein
MRNTRRHLLRNALLLGAAVLSLLTVQAHAQGRTRLVVGIQTIELRETVLASKVLDGAPFDIEWAVLPGPAAQLSGLYSKSIDIGLGGSTSLIFEQAKAEKWDEKNPPLQIVAAWENPDPKYPSIITAVRKDAGINSLKDLKGKRWAHNYGGYNYGQYIATLVKAGLGEKDISPARFTDQFAGGTAFNHGQVEVFSGSAPGIFESLKNGTAKVLIDNRETEVPGVTIFIARQDVIADKAKSEALGEFLARVRTHWTWYEKNLPAVEDIYVKKLQQNPERAQFTARHSFAEFKPVDKELGRKLQNLSDLFFEFKATPRKINVSSELSPRFNAYTVPGNASVATAR